MQEEQKALSRLRLEFRYDRTAAILLNGAVIIRNVGDATVPTSARVEAMVQIVTGPKFSKLDGDTELTMAMEGDAHSRESMGDDILNGLSAWFVCKIFPRGIWW